MTTRIAFIAAILLSAGVARAASSSVPAAEEIVLETGSPATSSYVACDVSPSAHIAALLQVPADERGKVEAASCATNVTWPTAVDTRDRR